ALSIGLHTSSKAQIVNNTITSEGDCMILSGGGGSTAEINFRNNVMVGQTDWRQPWEKTCGHYADGGSAKVNWTKNHVTNIKNNGCPGGDSICNSAVLLANTSMSGFDPVPLSGSPVIN